MLEDTSPLLPVNALRGGRRRRGSRLLGPRHGRARAVGLGDAAPTAVTEILEPVPQPACKNQARATDGCDEGDVCVDVVVVAVFFVFIMLALYM